MDENIFYAGFGRADITPTEPVPMNGFASSSERISTGNLSPLYALAVAVKDGDGTTAIVCSVDNVALGYPICDEARAWAEEQLGIPRQNIVISSIHQHSCPDPYNDDVPSSGRYRTLVTQGIEAALRSAVEDLKPAELYINTVQTQALSFVRNYEMNDGTFCGDNYGSTQSGYKCHESESDKELRLVKFIRKDAKDIVLVNFQAHPHMAAARYRYQVHYDWPGEMRQAVEKAMDVECVYFSGAGGNLNSTSRIKGENITTDHRQHGLRAAGYVLGAEGSYRPVEAGPVRCREVTVTHGADHSLDHLVDQARIVHEVRMRNSVEAMELVKDYPALHSIYHATAILAKAAQAPTRDITISVITFGDVALTSHPYEMFDTNGMELRSGSVGNANYAPADQLPNPFAMTLIATMGNGTHGYVPSRLGYVNGGYSTDITRFAPGSGEELVGDYLRLLNQLHT